MWGDINIEVKQILDRIKDISQSKRCVLTFHEGVYKVDNASPDAFIPSKTIYGNDKLMSYVRGLANYGFHTIKKQYFDTTTNKDVKYFALEIGNSPYYWTKAQVPVGVQLPEFIVNPTFAEVQK